MVQGTAEKRSPLQASLDDLGGQLTLYSGFVIALISLGGLLQHRPAMEIFTVAVSLAVAAIPEGLPVVATITLALGVLRLSRRNVIVRKLPAVEALGSVTVLCADKTGTLTTNVLSVQCMLPADGEPVDLQGAEGRPRRSAKGVAEMLRIGALCNNAEKGAGGSYSGNAMDIALMHLLEGFGEADPRATLVRAAETPFSSDTKYMAVQYGDTLYVKGAPEVLLGMIRPGAEDRWSPALSARGLRTLAVASGPSLQGLRLCGVFGLMDPPRPGIASVLQRLAAAHLRVIMVTGDAKETAVNLARSIGVPHGDSSVIPGDTVSALGLPDLERVSIVYRAHPQHKLQLVQALQARLGAVVAMTGDGVNDAPALKMADIGVAMGRSGTDVAREAAKLILADDALARLLDGIHEGKAIFANIRHFVRFQLATSLAALGLIACSMFVPSATGQPPLNPMQILLINIIMDGPPAQSLGVEPIHPDVLARPPRPRGSPILSRELLLRTGLSAAYILAGCLAVFYWECQVAPGDSSRTFAAFVLFSLFNAYSCRSLHKSVWALGLWRNTFLNASIGVALLTLAGILYTPWLSRVFQTTPLAPSELGILFGLAASLLAFDELVKMASGWDAWHASTAGYIPISHVGDS
jgi:Ca2+-transporting ATPase